ncbi:hypothetical protein E2C01_079283 [Portunus trituberculatus]|uniref:Uncharacterized protein n=1 Tax=Portunus trituberculatus TaxID=210409 RepID=A0A5B7IQ76_PORTR|nr:hypothetical protein [Portunus trituberculatus]
MQGCVGGGEGKPCTGLGTLEKASMGWHWKEACMQEWGWGAVRLGHDMEETHNMEWVRDVQLYWVDGALEAVMKGHSSLYQAKHVLYYEDLSGNTNYASQAQTLSVAAAR